MELPIYQVDAFAGRVFRGNPAAVCPLDSWLPEETMQAIAAENNLAETAFFVPEGDGYEIRWFTPVVEADLCGHATLASGYVVMERLAPERRDIAFNSRGRALRVSRRDPYFALDFPVRPPVPCPVPDGLAEALGAKPGELLAAGQRYFAVYDDAETVRSLAPDMAALTRLAPNGVAVTAAGGGYDFVSRFFVPAKGIPEDSVTGSTHTALIPYWTHRLGRSELRAAQLSARGGELFCRLNGDRVEIAGEAALYMEGRIRVPEPT